VELDIAIALGYVVSLAVLAIGIAYGLYRELRGG